MSRWLRGSRPRVASPPVAHAQEAGGVTRRAGRPRAVVVTAQRREQVLQEVPISHAGRRHRPDRRHRGRGPRRPQRLRAGPAGVERQPDPAALRDPRHPDRRFRRRHRPGGRRVRGRHLRGALRRVAARLQRHRAHRGAEGPAGHPVRPQQRRRRDLDRHAPAGATTSTHCCDCASATTTSGASRAWSTLPHRPTASRCASTASTTRATAGCEDAATGKDLWPEDNWAVRAALRWDISGDTSGDAHLGPRRARPAGAAGVRPGTGRPRRTTDGAVSRPTPTPSSTRARPGSTTT